MPAPCFAPLRRRQILQLAAASLVVPPAFAAEPGLSLSSAINRAARFRALSQRCAKAYCQLFLDVLPDNARDTLGAAQRLIQIGFDDLARAGLPPGVGRQIQATQQEATALIGLLSTQPAKPAVAAVAAQADRMLVAANTATEAIEGLSRQGTAKLVNLAGRQRMLSQRLAKNYFMGAAGFDPKAVQQQSTADMGEFKQALVALGNAPISTPSIRNELALADSQWTFFAAALQRKPDPEGLRTVATTSERLLEVMNNLTNLYDAALKDVLGSA